LNFASSAAGYVRVELQGSDGQALSGFGFADSDELFGDTLQRVVTWRNKSDVSAIAGRPIRVHIVMRDADIYSLGTKDVTLTPVPFVSDSFSARLITRVVDDVSVFTRMI
jgi:hypothetical protein